MEGHALGKGLAALIPERVDSVSSENVSNVRTDLIKENKFQPRINFNDEKLAELMASIKEKGVIQPILVRKHELGYQVIAGERRLRAARNLGMDKVPVIVKNVSDQEALVLALVENIQRAELNPIEEAKGYRRLIEDFNFTQDAVAQSVGKDRSTVGNFMRLLRLPEEIQMSVSNGVLSFGHARTLLSIEDEKIQKKIFDKVVKKKLSVRELENLVKPELNRLSRRGKAISSSQKDIYLLTLEEDLQKILGTKVRIQAKKKRGKLVIEYYSLSDLERIVGCIKK